MKTIITLLFVFGSIGALAQGTIYGMGGTSTTTYFSSIDLGTGTVTNLNTSNSNTGYVAGEWTYDPIHNIFFAEITGSTTHGIIVVDGASGNFIDTIPVPRGSFHSFEYDPISNRLIGISYSNPNPSPILTSLDIATGSYTDIDTVTGIGSYLQQGESALDPFNRRYFIKSDIGIVAIDATNGNILDTFGTAGIGNYFSIEYDANTNRIFALRHSGTLNIMFSLDFCTRSFNDIDTLNGLMAYVGASTFNPVLNVYYTPLGVPGGIASINPTTGQVIDVLRNTSFAVIEAAYSMTILPINPQPQNQVVNLAANAVFSVATTAASPSYHWQTCIGNGFQNITNGGQYSGATTPALTVSNATMANNNQQFRCIVSSGVNSSPTRIVVLKVNNTTGINSVTASPSISILTNAVSRQVIVKSDADIEGAGYALYDMAGRELKRGTLKGKTSTIGYDGYASGMYVLHIEGSIARNFKLVF